MPNKKLPLLTLFAAISIFSVNVVGSIQRVIGSDPILAITHRLASVLTAGLVLAASAAALRQIQGSRTYARVLSVVAGLLAAQIILPWLNLPLGEGTNSALHFFLALSLQALLTSTAVWILYQYFGSKDLELQYRTRFARLSIWTLLSLIGLIASGAIVTRLNGAMCNGWPLCYPENPIGWLSLVHRASVLIAGVMIGASLIQAWRTQRSQTVILVSTSATAVLFIAQALLGARLVSEMPPYLIVIHQATAAAVWSVMVIQIVAVGLNHHDEDAAQEEAKVWRERQHMARDLLMLTKPIVVALLLVTTYAGMVIGTGELPAWGLVLPTMLGGFLAAGGSGAINQYIDRNDDSRMQRTQKRPIPSGRLTPGEGLAFGVSASLLSFYLMLAFVNLTAALLTLAGIIYYVLIYSLMLKKTTVQNIVIGGGAGAIPPLVGWAAATGGLNVPSLFLFAVVFMWTPPHFWALALVRRKDYARAGVPMLPVIHGENETRRQILIYTVELVILTLFLPIFGLGSALYVIGAGLLGLWLLSAAWKVWKHGGNKLAWKMYRYSSMYLAFLFIVMMVDALL